LARKEGSKSARADFDCEGRAAHAEQNQISVGCRPADLDYIARGDRVAESARLESVYTGNRSVGSNPTPFATSVEMERKPRNEGAAEMLHMNSIVSSIFRRPAITVRKLIERKRTACVRSLHAPEVDASVGKAPGFYEFALARHRVLEKTATYQRRSGGYSSQSGLNAGHQFFQLAALVGAAWVVYTYLHF
jgi:hypothetical protein